MADFKFPDEIEETKDAAASVAEPVEVEVEIEDDTPTEDRNRKPMKEAVEDPTDEELASYDEKVQARIKKFTRGYHDERRAKEQALREREAAETYARQVIEENKRLQQQVAVGNKAFIETSKTAAAAALVAAKEKYKKAYEAGDPDAITEAQADITKATLDLDKVTSMRPVAEPKEDEVSAPAPAPRKQQIDPRTQEWVEANSDWWGVDEEMTASALGLDKKLARQYGVSYVGTEEYYRTIDKVMRKRFPEHFGVRSEDGDGDPPQKQRATPADEEDPPRRARSATVVAPATRSTSPNRIRLKASEAAIARRLGVPLEEYAKQVAQLKRNS